MADYWPATFPACPPKQEDVDSVLRSAHLLQRLAGSPEDGFKEFKLADKSLSNCEPKRMSRLTSRILHSIDSDGVRTARIQNFMYLHEELKRHNLLKMDPDDTDGPICFHSFHRKQGLDIN